MYIYLMKIWYQLWFTIDGLYVYYESVGVIIEAADGLV